jgi:hypothetical protein
MIKPYKPDPEDPYILAKWFEDFYFLDDQDLARMAEMSIATIRRWRRIVRGQLADYRYPFAYTREPSILPEVWDCKSWFERMYNDEGWSVRQIAKYVGRSIKVTYNKLRRYGISLRSQKEAVQSSNPCCCREWLHKHYILGKKSKSECADLAGTCERTIRLWLTKFGIRPRSLSEAGHARHERWMK